MSLQAIIVSDLHLGTDAARTKEFLDFLAEHPTDLLILNGDIVDAWAMARGSRWRKRHTKVLSAILKLSTTTPVIWLVGNHDEFLREHAPLTYGNIQLIPDSHVLTLNNGRRLFVFHGDALDILSTRWKWIAHLGSMGYDLSLWFNTWYNRFRTWRGLPYYSISQALKRGVKLAVNFTEDFELSAVRYARQQNCDAAVCGHIHKAEMRDIQGTQYINSGDWVESMTAILVHHDGTIELYTHKATSVAAD